MSQQSNIAPNPMQAASSSSIKPGTVVPSGGYQPRIVNFWEIDAEKLVFGKVEDVSIPDSEVKGKKAAIKYMYSSSQGEVEGTLKWRFPKRITEKQAKDPQTNEPLFDDNGKPIVVERLSGVLSEWGVGSRGNDRGGLNWTLNLDIDITGDREKLEDYVNREKAQQYHDDYLDYVEKMREGCRRMDKVYEKICTFVLQNKVAMGLTGVDLGPGNRATVISHPLNYKKKDLEDGSSVRMDNVNPSFRPKLSHFTTEKGEMIASTFLLPDGSPVIADVHPEEVWKALQKKSLDVDALPHLRDLYSNSKNVYVRKGNNKAVILDWWERQSWSEQQETIDVASQFNMSVADSLRHQLSQMMAFTGVQSVTDATQTQTQTQTHTGNQEPNVGQGTQIMQLH